MSLVSCKSHVDNKNVQQLVNILFYSSSYALWVASIAHYCNLLCIIAVAIAASLNLQYNNLQ
jgi:hypothetical protein